MFQIRPEYVNLPEEKLLIPEINSQLGIHLISKAKSGCNLPGNLFVVCYNRGIAGGKLLDRPELDGYYLKVEKTYECLKRFSAAEIFRGKEKSCYGK